MLSHDRSVRRRLPVPALAMLAATLALCSWPRPRPCTWTPGRSPQGTHS
jgi:hypothetical protein